MVTERALGTLVMFVSLLSLSGETTGTEAFIMQQFTIKNLCKEIDKDLKEAGGSITHLKLFLQSLAEIVLQSWRDLDGLLMKERRLCAVLNKGCCFYIDYTGMTEDLLNR